MEPYFEPTCKLVVFICTHHDKKSRSMNFQRCQFKRADLEYLELSDKRTKIEQLAKFIKK